MKSLMTSMILMAVVFSCQSSSEEDMVPQPPPPPVAEGCDDVEASLSGNVMPIINTKCAVSGCHISGGQFPDFTDRANVIQFSSGIRNFTQNNVMPPASSGITLTAEELEAISCWVEGGALDN
jgi:hypothetical protein